MPKQVDKGVCMSTAEYNKLKKKASGAVSGTKRKSAPKKKKTAKKPPQGDWSRFPLLVFG